MLGIQKGVFRQILSAVCCCLAAMVNGSISGWSAGAFPKIRNNEIEFQLTVFQEAWVLNIFYLGVIVGAPLAGTLMDAVGRKLTLLLFNICALLNWILLTFAFNAYMLYIARLFAGFFLGGVLVVIPVYLSETLQPKIRGSVSTLFTNMYFMGYFYEYAISPLVSYFFLGIFSGALSVFFAITFIFMPETPYFYMMKNNKIKAETTLRWLRGDVNCQKELGSIQSYVQNMRETRAKMTDLFLNKDYRLIFLNVQMTFWVQKMTGLFTIMSYLTVVLPPKMGFLTPVHGTLIIGFSVCVSVFAAAILIDRKGRKPLFIFSNASIIVTSVITGLWYFLYTNTHLYLENTTIIPFVGILLYSISFCLGAGPIASIYQGEMLPSNLKAPGCTVTAILSALFSVLNTTCFAWLNAYVGLYANFLSFALISVFALFYAHYYFIETKGKSLEQIQLELKKDRRTNDFYLPESDKKVYSITA